MELRLAAPQREASSAYDVADMETEIANEPVSGDNTTIKQEVEKIAPPVAPTHATDLEEKITKYSDRAPNMVREDSRKA